MTDLVSNATEADAFTSLGEVGSVEEARALAKSMGPGTWTYTVRGKTSAVTRGPVFFVFEIPENAEGTITDPEVSAPAQIPTLWIAALVTTVVLTSFMLTVNGSIPFSIGTSLIGGALVLGVVGEMAVNRRVWKGTAK